MTPYASQLAARRKEITLGPPVAYVAVGDMLGPLPLTIGYLRTNATTKPVYVRECRKHGCRIASPHCLTECPTP